MYESIFHEKLLSDHVTILHMPWQLSSGDMCSCDLIRTQGLWKEQKYPQAYHSEIISCDMGFWFYQNYEVKWLEDWIHKLTAKITSCALTHWHLGKWKSFQNMLAQIIVYCLSCVRLYTGSMMTYCQLGEHTSTKFCFKKILDLY